jgi:hypothetical protein
MVTGLIVDWESLAKRLMVLMANNVIITTDSGHRWIESAQSHHVSMLDMLEARNHHVRSKVYGGVLEALDRIDSALKEAGDGTLLEQYADWEDEMYP